jgi:hypothetical protein
VSDTCTNNQSGNFRVSGNSCPTQKELHYSTVLPKKLMTFTSSPYDLFLRLDKLKPLQDAGDLDALWPVEVAARRAW